jgi:hypothetical protein
VQSELRHLYRTILLTSDDPRIGIGLADELASCGCLVAGPFADNRDALAWVDGGYPDLALLDAVLSDGSVSTLISALEAGTSIAFWASFEPAMGTVRASLEGRDGPYRDRTAEGLLDEVLATG